MTRAILKGVSGAAIVDYGAATRGTGAPVAVGRVSAECPAECPMAVVPHVTG